MIKKILPEGRRLRCAKPFEHFQSILPGLILLLLTACSNGNNVKSMKSQPTIDSTYVITSMKAEPKFRKQIDWAKKFYRERRYQLGWFKDNTLVPQAQQMLSVIAKSEDDGLNPKDYQIKDFNVLFESLEKLQKDTVKYREVQKEIDVALSATYFVWASDYYRGRVVPKENKDVEWDVKRNKIKLHKALATVLQYRKSKYDYAEFEPLHPQYANLKKSLAIYRKIKNEGGWPILPKGTVIKPGASSPTVSKLRKRILNQAGESDTASNNIYDAQLVAAVKSFQSSQGLTPDGQVRGETLRLLNIPVEQRINSIILNMERWRWIPKSFEPDYLLVNIPEFKLRVYEKGKEKVIMKVIVGKTMNSTPIFSDKLEYVVLSPYWNVPMSILQKELIPNLINDPGYLERLDMEIVTNKGDLVEPSGIDWGSVNEKNFKYIVRRRPGPKNDLGDVKFIFPNTNDIYLHDTPHDELFNQASRDFSHGCVRVERPVDLAVYLLRNVPGYNRTKINSIISERKEKFVPVKQKLPVYLVYFTAEAGPDGNVKFYEDIYGHDKVLAAQYFQ
ncbi:L,D-transpeptidase family protein [Flavihumibacter sp. R14]|nr:L,D-transpeptidase family protein [Flavihumibacter soli]